MDDDNTIELLAKVVSRSIELRGYVVLRFAPGSTVKTGDRVPAYVDGPMVTLGEPTDRADWVAQVKIGRSITKREVARARGMRGIQYYRAYGLAEAPYA